MFEPYTQEAFDETTRRIAERGIFPDGGPPPGAARLHFLLDRIFRGALASAAIPC